VSIASHVPQTWDLSGDDAWDTLKRTGRVRLARDAFRRFRASDGTSHARSLAFLLSLLLVQGVIALVAIASIVHQGRWSELLAKTLRAVSPGPAGKVLTDAVEQAHRTNASHDYTILLVILVCSSLVTAGSLMGQVERGMNRLYGIERDRPTLRKYVRALLLALTAGSMVVGAFVAVGIGHVATASFGGGTGVAVWNALRWPLGLLLAIGGIALIFRWSPFRHQPAWSWLTFGASMSVGLWMVATIGLSVFFRNSASFGETYGSLAGLVALLFWSLVTSVAVLYGGAVAAQLEAIRAGTPAPLDVTSARDETRTDREAVGVASPARPPAGSIA
jgi:YihY family inner membrane protein